MDLNDIITIIAHGENSSVVFNSSSVGKESIAKDICAFSNSLGGVILLGVEDSGELTGIDKSFTYEEWIMNIARDAVIPSVIPNFKIVEINNKLIGIVEVPKVKDKLYQTTDNRFFVRVGSTNRVAMQLEIIRLFQQCVQNKSFYI